MAVPAHRHLAAAVAIIDTALSFDPPAITPFGLTLTVEDGLLLIMALVPAFGAFALAGWAVF